MCLSQDSELLHRPFSTFVTSVSRLSFLSPPISAAFPDLSSMADKKISTIILEVDLDCSCCVKKITKTLKKYPEIQTQIFNHEKKTVTISGPFDPEKLMKCICCKAGKYIKSYEIVIDKPKPKSDPPKKADQPKPDPPKKPEDPPKKPDPKAEPPKTDPPKPEPPKPKPQPPKPELPVVPVPVPVPAPEPPKPQPQPPKPEPPVVPIPVPVPAPAPPKPEPPVIPAQPYPVPVCCGPCYEGHGGGPCWQGWAPQPYPPPIWGRPCYEGYGAGPYSSPYAPPSACRFFSEEESSCRTM